MLRVYICHPFTGDEINNRADAARIVAELEEAYPDLQVINPLEIFEPLDGRCEECVILAACMGAIKHCDAVLQAEGWKKSAGCRAEAAFAIVEDIPVLDRETMDAAMLEVEVPGDGR